MTTIMADSARKGDQHPQVADQVYLSGSRSELSLDVRRMRSAIDPNASSLIDKPVSCGTASAHKLLRAVAGAQTGCAVYDPDRESAISNKNISYDYHDVKIINHIKENGESNAIKDKCDTMNDSHDRRNINQISASCKIVADGCEMEKDPLFQKMSSLSNGNNQGAITNNNNNNKNNGLPLRQRQLPASFWIEPNKPRAPYPAETFARSYQLGSYKLPHMENYSGYSYISGSQQYLSWLNACRLSAYDPQKTKDGTLYGSCGEDLVTVLSNPGSIAYKPIGYVQSTKCFAPGMDTSFFNKRIVSNGVPQNATRYDGSPLRPSPCIMTHEGSPVPLWRPIPTKTTNSNRRYHPFASSF